MSGSIPSQELQRTAREISCDALFHTLWSDSSAWDCYRGGQRLRWDIWETSLGITRFPMTREQYETLLLQASFRKQKIPDELSECFERQGKWHIWELNLAPFVPGKVGGFSCLGNRLWICASWNSLCFSPERVPSVPDKGFLLFGICRQPSFGYILFNSLCWWVLIKPCISSELAQNSPFSLPLSPSPSLSHSHLPTLHTLLFSFQSESWNSGTVRWSHTQSICFSVSGCF